MVPEPEELGMGEAFVDGTDAYTVVARPSPGIRVHLMRNVNTREKDARKAGEKYTAKSFYTHGEIHLWKDIHIC